MSSVLPAAVADSNPYRVLIVEDDRSQAMFAEAILRGAGMQAEVVAIPERMMDALERFNPDLVLMDRSWHAQESALRCDTETGAAQQTLIQLIQGVDDFARELAEHIRLEDEVLFPLFCHSAAAGARTALIP